MNINNKKIVEQMKDLIKSRLSLNDILRYYHTFRRESDYNIYKYGNLDIYYWDLQERLKSFGVTHRFVLGEELTIFNYKVDTIEKMYIFLVRRAVQEIIEEDVLCPTK